MDLNDNQSNISGPELHLSEVLDMIEEQRTNNLQPMDDPMDGPSTSNGQRPMNNPCIKIIEQPAPKALRFRYECEGRSAGSIPGVNSTTENKTYPTIQIVGYKGRAVVVVSCVTKDKPYRPHPHNLVGRDNCKRGICTIEINNESMTASFQNLGIQCVKRKDIDDALKMREEIRVDPFRTGFSHKDNPTSIDLNVVRLCFQAFLGGSQKGRYSILEPVVSEPIYDKKAMSDLLICRLSDASASVFGGKEIILLCEKVTKDDIQIKFFEEKDGHIIWEDNGEFQPSDVHKQVAIYFKTPRYRTTQIDNAVNVWIQLRRPSDGVCSEPRRFMLTPADSSVCVIDSWKRNHHNHSSKRQKLSSESELLRQIPSGPPTLAQSTSFIEGMVIERQFSGPSIKEEPESSPKSYLSTILSNPILGQPSPMYDSRTPSPLEYHQFPNSNLYGQASLPQISVQQRSGIQTNHGIMSGCVTTDISSTLNSQSTSSQTNYSPLTQLPCPTDSNNEPNLMDSFSSFDTNELLMIDDSEQVLSADLSARLQLADGNIPDMSNEVIVQGNMNMTDSYERIATNTLDKLLCENYTKPGKPY